MLTRRASTSSSPPSGGHSWKPEGAESNVRALEEAAKALPKPDQKRK